LDFDQIIHDISALGVNLYDFALYTQDGVKSYRFQPCSNCLNSYSVAKAFVLTALGMLWDEGRFQLDDPIGNYLDFPSGADPKWKAATIDHAISHRLGFQEGFLDIDTEDTTLYPSEDYLSMVFAHPLEHAPGTHEQYTDAAYYLLSRLVSRIAEENVDSFLNRRLIRPMRFSEIAWSRCPLEYPIGATGLYISAKDMVKLGALYLSGGMWDGTRLLSREWVDTVISRRYEFHPLGKSNALGKGGMYGQMLMFCKKQGFAAAWHAHEDSDKRKLVWEYIASLCP